jgi:hypothetical protein
VVVRQNKSGGRLNSAGKFFSSTFSLGSCVKHSASIFKRAIWLAVTSGALLGETAWGQALRPNIVVINADRGQLVDLTADPYEQENLHGNPEHTPKLKEMQRRLGEELAKLPRHFGEFR